MHSFQCHFLHIKILVPWIRAETSVGGEESATHRHASSSPGRWANIVAKRDIPRAAGHFSTPYLSPNPTTHHPNAPSGSLIAGIHTKPRTDTLHIHICISKNMHKTILEWRLKFIIFAFIYHVYRTLICTISTVDSIIWKDYSYFTIARHELFIIQT